MSTKERQAETLKKYRKRLPTIASLAVMADCSKGTVQNFFEGFSRHERLVQVVFNRLSNSFQNEGKPMPEDLIEVLNPQEAVA